MHDDADPRIPTHGAPAAATPPSDLDPIDRDWIARRSAVAPLVLGLVSVALSPLLLGLLFGPLGMRAGIDLWRHGTRRAAVALAIALGFAGTVASVTGAVLWGSILASVLLGRDAMREAERWTGRDVSAATVEIAGSSGDLPDASAGETSAAPNGAVALSALGPTHERWAILFTDEGSEPCLDAAATLDDCAKDALSVRAVVVAPGAMQPEARRALQARLDLAGIELHLATMRAVPPLDAIAAMPTLVIVDRRGRIEKAIVGAHPRADIEALLRGDAALPDDADRAANRPAGVDRPGPGR